jgi:arachidonate 15-lipoxygenase
MSGFSPKNELPKVLADIGAGRTGSLGPGPSWEYIWNYTYLSPLAMAAFPPPADFPTFEWILKVAESVVEAALNSIDFEADSATKSKIIEKTKALQNSIETRTIQIAAVQDLVSDITAFGSIQSSDRPKSIDDYARLFRVIGLPAVASDYNQDSTFAAMRTAGPNPLMIRRIRALPDKFPITDAQFQSVMMGDSIDAALGEGRMYFCDYEMLATQQVDPEVSPAKFAYVPMALFCATRNSGALVPVAIQTQQQPVRSGIQSNLFLADGSPSWLIAKTIVEMADGNIHEAVMHLGRTHLLIEPFVVATGRKLDPNHPVTRLLWPHFEGTLLINFAAVFTLLAKGGALEQLDNGTVESILKMTTQDLVEHYPFNKSFLPASFSANGGRDVMDLKDYAYRDDSLQYWNAIQAWVHQYLGDFYSASTSPNDPRSVLHDIPLQQWCLELISQDGGRVKDFGINDQIPTLDYLEQALTMIIFTSSVQHAAVNFPQYDLMSYCPNMPLACYSQFPGPGPAGLQQYLDILPPMSRAALQMNVGFVLGSVHYTELGAYPPGYFTGEQATQAAAFGRSLDGINSSITEKNTFRRPYRTLLRAGIPQSINV